MLYGTGAIKLTPDNEVVRVGGVKYTISNGVIYDAKALLKEVKNMVDRAKEKETSPLANQESTKGYCFSIDLSSHNDLGDNCNPQTSAGLHGHV